VPTEPKCRHCGLYEDDHHAFEAMDVPPGCKCEPRDWTETVPSVCPSFDLDEKWLVRFTDDRRCKTCEHGEECHGRQTD